MVPSPVLGALVRLEQALTECAPAPSPVLEQLLLLRATVEEWSLGAAARLVAPRHGRWVRTPTGAFVDLGRRRALRRLVARLVEASVEEPGRALPVSELLQAGWPDERLDGHSGLNRLYVALTRLRSLGLGEILL
ncbi:MAG: Signal transduction response regulator, partial [Labilithrix sp.]|nr:Signal transduction response regulator [Labilithrix sp.]